MDSQTSAETRFGRNDSFGCEIKAAPLEIKAVGDRGEYEGHFAIFGNVDDGGDMCHPGMFLKTIAENGRRVKPLYLHDFEKLLGPTPDVLQEDSTGLFAKGHLTLGTFWADQVWALLKDGALNEGSFMYMPIKFDNDTAGVRHLREVKLYDLSFVPLGMNGLTSVRAVKQAQLRQAKAAIPYKSTALALPDASWDANAALAACDTPAKLRAAHAWQDPDGDPAHADSYRLPHHDGEGKCVLAALTLDALAIMTGTSGIPDADLYAVREHLDEHFKQFGKRAPWVKAAGVEVYADWLGTIARELKEGRMLSASNLDTIQRAMTSMREACDMLQELCDAAQPTTDDAPKSEPALAAVQDRLRLSRRLLTARLQMVN